MKKLLLIAVAVMFIVGGAVPASATIFNTLNAEIDAPNLIGVKQISKDLFFGASAEKPIATNLFFESFAGVEDDHNYLYTVKFTYYGCLANCPE